MPQRRMPPPGKNKHILRLYVAGRSSNGMLALHNLTRFCELWLRGRYELRVIDVLKEPEAAASDAVVATPTLINDGPGRAVRIFGTLADEEALAEALGIERAKRATPPEKAGRAERP